MMDQRRGSYTDIHGRVWAASAGTGGQDVNKTAHLDDVGGQSLTKSPQRERSVHLLNGGGSYYKEPCQEQMLKNRRLGDHL